MNIFVFGVFGVFVCICMYLIQWWLSVPHYDSGCHLWPPYNTSFLDLSLSLPFTLLCLSMTSCAPDGGMNKEEEETLLKSDQRASHLERVPKRRPDLLHGSECNILTRHWVMIYIHCYSHWRLLSNLTPLNEGHNITKGAWKLCGT